MGVFSKVFKPKDQPAAAANATRKPLAGAGVGSAPAANGSHNAVGGLRPAGEDAWVRKQVRVDEVVDLIHACTHELKANSLDAPFLLLPFRPTSNPTSARNFIRAYFKDGDSRSALDELKILSPLVLCSILKWCWSRLTGGVVGWTTYELFRQGERGMPLLTLQLTVESQNSKQSFTTFIPLVASDARRRVIFDFFELLAAIAANYKANGLGGRQLSRLAGWWAFEHVDDAKGFDSGYRSWATAADATSHLFFAYLWSLAPDSAIGSTVSKLPRSLQTLLQKTEYPPECPTTLLSPTSKLVMVVQEVSPTPHALLRRMRDFDYDEVDASLGPLADGDPLSVLTSECRRVLDAISSTNGKKDNSWSRFEDFGFQSLLEVGNNQTRGDAQPNPFNRPTTPSWADFMSSGFSDTASARGPASLLHPDQVLPPLSARAKSSQSHRNHEELEPGVLASTTHAEIDETFWWVWMSSLAPEEPPARKAVFGRCAFVETTVPGVHWLIVEEIVRGAPVPAMATIIPEKRSRFSTLTKRKRNAPTEMAALPKAKGRADIQPDQQARVQAAAAALVSKRAGAAAGQDAPSPPRRGRDENNADDKTASVLTLQPVILKDAGAAMQWAKRFDKEALREQYLGNINAGKGLAVGASPSASSVNLLSMSAGEATARAAAERDGAAGPGAPPNGADKSPPAASPVATRASPPLDKEKELPRAPSWAQEPELFQRSFAGGQPAQGGQPPATQSPAAMAAISAAASSPSMPASGPAGPIPPRVPVFPRKRLSKESPRAPPQPTPPPKPQASPAQTAAAAAAAAYKTTTSPEPRAARKQSTRFKGLFGRKKEKDAKDSPRGKPTRLHRKQDSLASVPSTAATDDGLDAGEPGPEISTDDKSYDPNDSVAAFSNFSQGPLDDAPAFVPDDTPRGQAGQAGQSSHDMYNDYHTRAAALLNPHAPAVPQPFAAPQPEPRAQYASRPAQPAQAAAQATVPPPLARAETAFATPRERMSIASDYSGDGDDGSTTPVAETAPAVGATPAAAAPGPLASSPQSARREPPASVPAPALARDLAPAPAPAPAPSQASLPASTYSPVQARSPPPEQLRRSPPSAQRGFRPDPVQTHGLPQQTHPSPGRLPLQSPFQTPPAQNRPFAASPSPESLRDQLRETPPRLPRQPSRESARAFGATPGSGPAGPGSTPGSGPGSGPGYGPGGRTREPIRAPARGPIPIKLSRTPSRELPPPGATSYKAPLKPVKTPLQEGAVNRRPSASALTPDQADADSDQEQSPPGSFPREPRTTLRSEKTVSTISPLRQDSDSGTSAADRWAQIRKNAAERRQSEDSQRPGNLSRSATGDSTGASPPVKAKPDDGDASEEETIESRVARIKARVAELTSGSTVATSAR